MKGADSHANNHKDVGSAAAGMVEFGIVPPLFNGSGRWDLPIVSTVIHNPFTFVEPLLLPIDILKMLYALIPG